MRKTNQQLGLNIPIPERADLPPFPDGVSYLWEWWCEIREMSGDELTPVNYKAWFDLMGIKAKPFEVKAVSGITRMMMKSRL